MLATQTFVNPCSEVIPAEAIGIVARFTVTPVAGDGEVHIDAFHPESANANVILKFTKGQMMMFEAGILLNPDGSFGVQTGNAGADVTVDLLGYLLPDPAGAGLKGDTGDIGATGAKGDKGDKGDAGTTNVRAVQADGAVACEEAEKLVSVFCPSGGAADGAKCATPPTVGLCLKKP